MLSSWACLLVKVMPLPTRSDLGRGRPLFTRAHIYSRPTSTIPPPACLPRLHKPMKLQLCHLEPKVSRGINDKVTGFTKW